MTEPIKVMHAFERHLSRRRQSSSETCSSKVRDSISIVLLSHFYQLLTSPVNFR
jgi:DNA-binding IclR family transcriptional regulator